MSGPHDLAARLRARIHTGGPLSFRDWMETALYDAREGYYCRAGCERWGRGGDYRTSPERSLLFAATFARYFADLYKRLASPPLFAIHEAGAGAGHFARGVLDAVRLDFPQIYATLEYRIDERSPAAQADAGRLLAAHADRVRFVSGPGAAIGARVVFANELLDALPVHRVSKSGGELCEMFVDVDERGDFVWRAGRPSTPRLAENLARCEIELRDGQTAEVNLAAEDWLREVARTLERGFIVLVDYGAPARELYDAALRPAGTLRAVRRHRLTDDPLADPGHFDLTAHVNWTRLTAVAGEEGLRVADFKSQNEFLLAAGALAQLEAMTVRAQNDADRAALALGAREMILPAGMGARFQVLVLEKGSG